MHQLLAAHFQAENADREVFVDRHVLGDVHGERGLAHARPRCDHDHLRWMQAARHPVEFDKAGGDSGDSAFALVKFLDRLDRFHDLILHGKHLTFEPVFADCEDLLFHFVEQIIHFVLLFVGAPHAFGRRRNDLAQNVFVANDLEIVVERWPQSART